MYMAGIRNTASIRIDYLYEFLNLTFLENS